MYIAIFILFWFLVIFKKASSFFTKENFAKRTIIRGLQLPPTAHYSVPIHDLCNYTFSYYMPKKIAPFTVATPTSFGLYTLVITKQPSLQRKDYIANNLFAINY